MNEKYILLCYVIHIIIVLVIPSVDNEVLLLLLANNIAHFIFCYCCFPFPQLYLIFLVMYIASRNCLFLF